MNDKLYEERPISFYAHYLDKFGKASGPFLDMGSGHGHILELAQQRGIEAFGVEYNIHRVNLSLEKGLNVTQHDLCNPLPFPDAYFGIVYCGQVIEHVPPHGQQMIVNEAYRVLKPGGIFQIRSPNRHNEQSRKSKGHDYLLTMAELRNLLAAAGFQKLDFSINYPLPIPEIPKPILNLIWKLFKPDQITASANAICIK